MPMKFRHLDAKVPLGCLRVYVRVDWNVPVREGIGPTDSVKLTRSYPLLTALRQRGAMTFVLTHLGRPKRRESALSTKPLARIVSAHSGLPIQFLDADFSSAAGRARFTREVDRFQPGDIVLLENVRFQTGEETNAAALVKAYAEHGDVFINDAFASCHRNHASVVGLAAALPSVAGPALMEEVDALSRLLAHPRALKHPYVAFIGGAKLTDKLPVLRALLKTADKVCIGGAMAHPFFAAKRLPIGKSYMEKGSASLARPLLRNAKLLLPTDAVIIPAKKGPLRAVPIKDVGARDVIVDIGHRTMRDWAALVRTARTIVWNGPLGRAETPAYAHGSLLIGRSIAARAKGNAYGVAGGGDTLPVVRKTGMEEWFDFVSTGGGAMLEFLSTDGRLPGLVALQGAQKKRFPHIPRTVGTEQGISCAIPASSLNKKKAKKGTRKRS